MKKILFLCLLMVSSVSLIFPQTPCFSEYKINNGGGNCPDLNGGSATGTITLSFEVEPGSVPTIVSVFDITDPLVPPVLVEGVQFGPGTLLNNGDAKYCYYVGPNHNNNLQGANSEFRILISYNGTPCVDEGALPVTFHSFTASRSNSVVNVKWTTVTETNNLGFEIQRLIGNGSWQILSFIATQSDRGTSSSALTYSYEDLNPANGISQYRIRQIDIDNRSKLSEIRAVRGAGQKGKTIVYPNPSNDGKLIVVFENKDANRDVSLMDVNGRMIRQWKKIMSNNLQIDNLVTGFYTLRIVDTETNEQVVEKIVVKNR